MLTDCRYHEEHYRIDARMLSEYLANPSRAVYDGVLKVYFSISRIVEWSSRRPVVVEMLRLHPSFFLAPVPRPEGESREFYNQEWFVGSTGEFL